MYQYTAVSPTKSPCDGAKGQGEGIAFFNHFPKTFRGTYEKAEAAPTGATIFRRLSSCNCEWLCRPSVVISECGDSCSTNIETVQQSTVIVDSGVLQQYLPHITTFTGQLLPFIRDSTTAPTLTNATMACTDIIKSNSLDTFCENAFELVGALFNISVNYPVVRELFRTPDRHCQLTTMKDGTDKHFKPSKNLKHLRQLLHYLKRSAESMKR